LTHTGNATGIPVLNISKIIILYPFTKGNIKEIRDFCGECVFNRNAYYKNEFVIETLEGDMHCKLGDWIAKGVEEEIYLYDMSFTLLTSHLLISPLKVVFL
jgi:hypothetical protein